MVANSRNLICICTIRFTINTEMDESGIQVGPKDLNTDSLLYRLEEPEDFQLKQESLCPSVI